MADLSQALARAMPSAGALLEEVALEFADGGQHVEQ